MAPAPQRKRAICLARTNRFWIGPPGFVKAREMRFFELKQIELLVCRAKARKPGTVRKSSLFGSKKSLLGTPPLLSTRENELQQIKFLVCPEGRIIRKKAFLRATAARGIQPLYVCTATRSKPCPGTTMAFCFGGTGDELYKLIFCCGGWNHFDLHKGPQDSLCCSSKVQQSVSLPNVSLALVEGS